MFALGRFQYMRGLPHISNTLNVSKALSASSPLTLSASPMCIQRRGWRSNRHSYIRESSSNWWQKVIGVGAAGYTVVKMKGISVLIPLLKFAKIGPLLSMGASMGAYGWLFG